MTSFAQLSDPVDLFDRSHLMARPPRRRPGPGADLVLDQQSALASIHPQLPPTPAWTYERHLPGPVIEVDSNSLLRVLHRNRLNGGLPYRHVVVDSAMGTMNDPGTMGEVTTGLDSEEGIRIAALKPHTVVHLHGAPSAPDSDGWAENVIGCDEQLEVRYEFPRERWQARSTHGDTMVRAGAAPMFWYHDHGMGVTRLNVYAGLAGVWLVRDAIEDQLGLPTSRQREIPLVLMDRNLETVDGAVGGALTGRLLHKVETDVRECFAPVNLVNGLAWPRCEVSPRVHRLRLVNGSNARTYRLHFLGLTSSSDLAPVAVSSAAVQQIGTDSGLLGKAVDIPADGLVLSPGERADILVDFGLLAGSGTRHVAVYNSAPAPFGGQPLTLPTDEPTGSDLVGYRAIPHVMRFDVTPGPAVSGLGGRTIQGMSLDPDFVRLDHAHLPAGHDHTLIALREEDEVVYDSTGSPVGNRTMLFLHELMPEDMADAMGMNMHASTEATYDPVAGTSGVRPSGVQVTLPGDAIPWVTIGKRFSDASMVMIPQGSWHVWKVLNLSPDTHPFHIHLTQFQGLGRTSYSVDPAVFPGGQDSGSDSFTFVAKIDGVVEETEAGWKDTMRVNPGDRGVGDTIVSAEMLTVAGCFARHSGRYMYHCHILEHEDTEMMRPFTVLPADVIAVMGMMHH